MPSIWVQIKLFRRQCVPCSASKAPSHIPQQAPSHCKSSSFKQRPHLLTVSPSTNGRPTSGYDNPIHNYPRCPTVQVYIEHQGRNFPRTRVPNLTTSGNPKHHSRTSASITSSPCKVKAQGYRGGGEGALQASRSRWLAECSILSPEGGLCMCPSKGGTRARQALQCLVATSYLVS